MPTSIPPVLAPYLQSCFQSQTTTLITSTLETPANWLIIRLIKAALFGVDDEVTTRSNISTRNDATTNTAPTVVFLSFLKPYEFWVELGKKIGLDITTLTARKQLAYIDGLTLPNGSPPTQEARTIKPITHSLTDITHAITTAVSTLTSASATTTSSSTIAITPNPTTTSTGTTLVIDGLDYILATQPTLTATQLTTFISQTQTRQRVCATVLTIAADAPILHHTDAAATPLELQHSVLVRAVAYRARWVVQLRALETGVARDVSGVVRISAGGGGDDDGEMGEGLVEGEWLYYLAGDGSVRVWGRGE